MQKPTAIKIRIPLAHARVEILMRVIEEPAIPTPSEPEISRDPNVVEWREISKRLAKLENITVNPCDWP